MFVCDYVLTPQGWLHNQQVTLEHGRVKAIHDAPAQHDLPVYHGRLVPGFIDVQVNGGGGVLSNQERTPKALQQIMAAHLKYGTTGMMPR